MGIQKHSKSQFVTVDADKGHPLQDATSAISVGCQEMGPKQ